MDFSSLEPVPYDVSSPTTAGLYRGGGRFVKVLRSYRDWPVLPLLPAQFRSLALDTGLWRYEADVYLDGLASSLPAGLRLPILYDVQEPDPDHVILVLEDVKTTDSQWDHDRYGDAAELLGRLNARLTRNDALPAPVDRTPGRLTRAMVDGLVRKWMPTATVGPDARPGRLVRRPLGQQHPPGSIDHVPGERQMQRRRRVMNRRLRLGPDRPATLVHQHNPLLRHTLESSRNRQFLPM